MVFEDIIKDIVDNISGCCSGIMMGVDGVMVGSYHKSETLEDLNILSIEFTKILKEIKSSLELLKAGDVQEIAVKTETMMYLIKMISDEYFVAVLLEPLGNFGKARYLMKKSIPSFHSEL